MKKITEGMFARSKAGHDKGKLYIVWKVEDECVYLTDGRLRPLTKPKKKRWKHIQPIYRTPMDWDPKRINDDYVKRVIRLQEKEDENVESGCN